MLWTSLRRHVKTGEQILTQAGCDAVAREVLWNLSPGMCRMTITQMPCGDYRRAR